MHYALCAMRSCPMRSCPMRSMPYAVHALCVRCCTLQSAICNLQSATCPSRLAAPALIGMKTSGLMSERVSERSSGLAAAMRRRATWIEHGARSTEHGARSTEHGARSTEHGARSMEHGARSTEHGAWNLTLWQGPGERFKNTGPLQKRVDADDRKRNKSRRATNEVRRKRVQSKEEKAGKRESQKAKKPKAKSERKKGKTKKVVRVASSQIRASAAFDEFFPGPIPIIGLQSDSNQGGSHQSRQCRPLLYNASHRI